MRRYYTPLRNFRNTVHLNGQPSDAQKRGMLPLHVSLDDSRLDLDLAFDVASFFGLTQEEAEREAQKMLTTIKSQWRSIAATCGLKKDAHNEMAPAFALSEKMG